MVRGAVKGSELIFHGADYMKQYITPEAEAREVDPRLAQGLAATAWVSRGACRVTGWLVSYYVQTGTLSCELLELCEQFLSCIP